jgi:hypothetical protein
MLDAPTSCLCLAAISLGGCAPPAPPVATVPDAPPQSAPTAPAVGPPPAAAAQPEPPRLPPPRALSADEQKEAHTRCRPLADAVKSAVGKTDANSVDAVFRGLEALKTISSVPKLDDAARARCAELYTRDSQAYVVSTVAVSARGHLELVARLLATAFDRKKQLCPSLEPVPRDFSALGAGAYAVAPADYASPGWACLEDASILDKLSAQLSMKAEPAAGRFTVVARAMPLRDGRMMEWQLAGKVLGDKLEWGKPELR